VAVPFAIVTAGKLIASDVTGFTLYDNGELVSSKFADVNDAENALVEAAAAIATTDAIRRQFFIKFRENCVL
jgi:hypothetical protein